MKKLFVVSMKTQFNVNDQWFEFADSVTEIEQKFQNAGITEFTIEETE